jgi:alpha-beta hydrolase superfamily lysophospholipase
LLYGHGFASGPRSKLVVALGEDVLGRGVSLELLDLRVPSFERLRLSRMLEVIGEAIGGPAERVVLFGSSLGGLAASRVAERDPRVSALVLLAPAFRLGPRWRARLQGQALRRWEEDGWLEVLDHTTGAQGRVDHGFLLDLEAVDAQGGGWPDVRVPTLILHGRRDGTVDVESSRAFAAARRHVRLVELDDGHELVGSLPDIIRETDAFLVPFLGPGR